jgi:phage regulator Rha-like protein
VVAQRFRFLIRKCLQTAQMHIALMAGQRHDNLLRNILQATQMDSKSMAGQGLCAA